MISLVKKMHFFRFSYNFSISSTWITYLWCSKCSSFVLL